MLLFLGGRGVGGGLLSSPGRPTEQSLRPPPTTSIFATVYRILLGGPWSKTSIGDISAFQNIRAKEPSTWAIRGYTLQVGTFSFWWKHPYSLPRGRLLSGLVVWFFIKQREDAFCE